MTNFSQKTYDEILELLKQKALEKYGDKSWSGLRDGTFEALLTQLVAEASVLLSGQIDFRAGEAYLSTAELRNSVRKIAENIGLYPRERTGATTTLSIIATNDVNIPIGTAFVSANGLSFATTSALSLTTGTSLSGTVEAIHAEYEEQTHRSLGNALERIELGRENVLVEKLIVEVNGTEWERVDNLKNTSSVSEIYRIEYDDFNQVVLVFGDGTYGERLLADAEIVVDVFYGGGEAGNSVDSGDITTLRSPFTNSDNIDSITNTTACSGGRSADSIAKISRDLPATASQVAGLVCMEEIPSVLRNSLSWLADATVEKQYNTENSIYVPTANVIAYPTADEIQDMSATQQSELATFLANRGMIGVNWSTQDAYGADVEIELEVRLNNKNQQTQKEAEIKGVLVNNDDAIFAFDNLEFDAEYTQQQIIDAVMEVDGVAYVVVKKFCRKPQTIGGSYTSDCLLRMDLGDEAEDGYFQFYSKDTAQQTVWFYRPFLTDTIASTYVRSSAVNWLVKEYEWADTTSFSDDDGPYIKVNGSSKLEFKQMDDIFKTDEWNGSTYKDKYLLKVSWVSSGTTYNAYYHIDDTVAPSIIKTAEDADSPISGTAISATFQGQDYSSISVQIIQDQTNGSTGTLITKTGQSLTVSHNDANSLFASSPETKVPVSDYSFLKFSENPVLTSADNWQSHNNDLVARIHELTLTAGDLLFVYTSAKNANKLSFKHPREVLELNSNNITIRWI